MVRNENAPVYYDQINEYNGMRSPSTVHVRNVALTHFFQRYLLQDLVSVYDWDGIPESWDKDYFKYTLFGTGRICVFRTDLFGVIPQFCTLNGWNVFYRPAEAVVTNPKIRGTQRLLIGRDCELIRLMPDWGNAWDLITFYAEMMALTAETAGVNLVNSKLAYVFAVKDKTAAESMKKLYDQISGGSPSAYADKELFDEEGNPSWMTFTQNLQQTYITDKLLADLHRWENMFLTAIGIPNTNFEKTERMITGEIEQNQSATRAKAQLWLETMQDCISRVNKMFDLNISVRFAFDYKEGGDPDERTESLTSGTR